MKPFLTTVVLGLLLIGGFNYAVDPAGQWHPASADAVPKAWPEGKLWELAADFDDRVFKLARISSAPRPTIVVLGSSRGMLAETRSFAPGLTMLNASVNGASIEDHAAFWQALKDEGKTPERVILYADPWLLNANSGQIRWRRNIRLYEKFLWTVQGRRLPLWKEALRQRWRIFYDGLCELLSWKVLTASLERVAERKSLFSEHAVPGFVAERDGRGGWRADGSRVSPASEARVKSLEEIRASAAKYAEAKEVYSLDRYQTDEKSLKVLAALTEDMRAAGTSVMVVVPPYHAEVLARLAKRPDYAGVMARFLALLDEASDHGRRYPVCVALDPAASGCGEREFADGMHMLSSCNAKVLKRCLSAAPDWKAIAPIW